MRVPEAEDADRSVSLLSSLRGRDTPCSDIALEEGERAPGESDAHPGHGAERQPRCPALPSGWANLDLCPWDKQRRVERAKHPYCCQTHPRRAHPEVERPTVVSPSNLGRREPHPLPDGGERTRASEPPGQTVPPARPGGDPCHEDPDPNEGEGEHRRKGGGRLDGIHGATVVLHAAARKATGVVA